MTSTEILDYEVETSDGKYAPLSEQVQNNFYGIIFPKDEPEFGQAIQKGLQTLIDNGTYGSLLNKYGLSVGPVTKALGSVDTGLGPTRRPTATEPMFH